MKVNPENIDESLKVLDAKLGQLKVAFEQYFLGTRPREPVSERREVDRAFLDLTNLNLKNTALRFRFRSLSAKHQAFKRQWDDTRRRIDDGTYSRHRFKADLRGRDPLPSPKSSPATPTSQHTGDLFDAYLVAAHSCGQDVSALSREKLERILDKQRLALRQQYGDQDFRFKVVVTEGRVRLRAARANDLSS